MNKLQMKLENPVRLEELKPEETLKRIGLKRNHVLCDIGAGSGIFTIPAAKMTENVVYAVEVNHEMLKVIEGKAERENIKNVQCVPVHNDRFSLEDHSADIVLLVTVLHEIDDKLVFMNEVQRLLKESGKIAVIEFHKQETPMGPPIAHRMSKEEVLNALQNLGFETVNDFSLGNNFYCLTFERKIK